MSDRREDHRPVDTRPEGVLDTVSASERDQPSTATQAVHVASLAETIATIRAAHRERCFWMEQRKRADLSLGAYLRTVLGWTLDKPLAERNAIRKQAQEIIDSGEKYVRESRRVVNRATKGKGPAMLPDIPDALRPFAHIVVPQIEMRGKTDELEAVPTKAMTRLAEQLPVHQWALGVRGFGALGLAIIVGEAGDLGNYANPAKLWKRMGVAVIDGKRQGGLLKTAAKSEWTAHGYNRVRRSRLYTIGSALIMSGETPYRQVYLDRKRYETERAQAEGLTVAPAAKIPKNRHEEYRSLGHIDNRARRYVEKRLLRDLWRAWINS